MAEKITRQNIAELAGITLPQVDYLKDLDIVRADVGDHRKSFSPSEARLAVIAGRAMSYGLTPAALVEPIKWLRQQIAWPAGLAVDVTEAAIELEADRLRGPVYDGQPKLCIDMLAARLFAISRGANAFEVSQEAHEMRKERFEEAKKSQSDLDTNHVRLADQRARSLLKQSRKWPDIEEFRKVERAIEFELACKGKRDMFFHVATGAESWKTFLHIRVTQIEGESAWLVIDIRRLFTDRNLTI